MKVIIHRDITLKEDELKEIVTRLHVHNFVEWLVQNAKKYQTEPRDRTMLTAVSWLLTENDVNAVRNANRWAKENGYPTIKVGEFRRWLPMFLQRTFQDYQYKKYVMEIEEREYK